MNQINRLASRIVARNLSRQRHELELQRLKYDQRRYYFQTTVSIGALVGFSYLLFGSK